MWISQFMGALCNSLQVFCSFYSSTHSGLAPSHTPTSYLHPLHSPCLGKRTWPSSHQPCVTESPCFIGLLGKGPGLEHQTVVKNALRWGHSDLCHWVLLTSQDCSALGVCSQVCSWHSEGGHDFNIFVKFYVLPSIIVMSLPWERWGTCPMPLSCLVCASKASMLSSPHFSFPLNHTFHNSELPLQYQWPRTQPPMAVPTVISETLSAWSSLSLTI